MQEIYDTYRNMGMGAAWERFSSLTGMVMMDQDEPTNAQPPSAEEMATRERFFRMVFCPSLFTDRTSLR
jgi:hypothetical protein